MSRFLQQRLAELLSLVIGKSQAHASLNMTDSVFSVILYRAFFWFAMGVEKKSLIKHYIGFVNLLFNRSAPTKGTV